MSEKSDGVVGPGAIVLFFLFMVALAAPFLVSAVIYLFNVVPTVVTLPAQNHTQELEVTNPTYLLIKLIAVGSLALCGCFCGATASALFRERSDARLLHDSPFRYFIYITCFAFLTTFIFMSLIVSNMLSGDLLPAFEFTDGIDFRMGPAGFGKIAVWFFVFGFFERIVPDTLKRIVVQNLNHAEATEKEQE